MSLHTSGATTMRSAPAACSDDSFDAATGPPPTTTTRRPCSFRNVGKSVFSINQKSPGGFGLPGFGYVLLRSMLLVQDINAWTEGREAPGAAYSSSNNYTRRDSL